MLVTDWYVTNMSKNATNVIFCHQHNDVTNITVINNLEETILIIKNVIFMKNGNLLTKMATFWRKNGDLIPINGNFIRTKVTIYFQQKSKTVTFGNKR